MDLLFPLSKKENASFCRSAMEIGFDEFVVHKFIYTMQDSDLDVFQLMHDERISLLIYGWEICEIHLQNVRNAASTPAAKSYHPTRSVQLVLKWLARHTLDLWLGLEWDSCEYQMRKGLLYCMQRLQDVLGKVNELSMINWREMLLWDVTPWQHKYVKQFRKHIVSKKQTPEQSIEEIEAPASKIDIDYLREENVFIILLRLVKMIDSSFLEGAKQFSMRVLAAWNAVFQCAKDIPGNTMPQIPMEFKRCVVSICHIYLLVVYEMDGNRGFIIDNMLNNVRFYHQCFVNQGTKNLLNLTVELNFTPARFIALTCHNLNISMNDFFEIFCSQRQKNFCSLSGVISQSYTSYILGNQLMEMNNMNEEHFNAHIERYKNIFNSYLEEREISEIYIKDQLKRKDQQRTSHSMSPVVKNLTNFENKFCKGNRASNMGNCVGDSEESFIQDAETINEVDRKMDAIFENMPNNLEILNYVYRILAKRNYDGWYSAKIVLLLKIICHEVNAIETWRYHPGLTTDFMLGIETKLSKHYEDLAIIFQDHFFLQQEFWLTAFYLNPIRKYYVAVIRCGTRFQRRQHYEDEDIKPNIKHEPEERHENKYAKFGLLSSTIDVKEIVRIRNHDTPNADYDALNKSLAALDLSEQTIKDLLTVSFLPRNKSFAWAVNWPELRKRCKRLMKNPVWKRRLIELNMAEANDRLKYLNIDYEKYKNRPQLDYGSIEEGYENLMNFTDQGHQDDDSDDDDEDDDEVVDDDNERRVVSHDDADDDDEDDDEEENTKVKNEKRTGGRGEAPRMSSHDIDQLADIFSTGTRRTRARTAAAIASVIMSEDHSRKRNRRKDEDEDFVYKSSKDDDDDDDNEEEDVLAPIPTLTSAPANSGEDLSSDAPNIAKRNLKELLQESAVYSNDTPGFAPFPDIWQFDEQVLKTVDKKCAVLNETEELFQIFPNFKNPNVSLNANAKEVNASAAASCPPPDIELLDETTLSATEYDIHANINDLKNLSTNTRDEEIQTNTSKVTNFHNILNTAENGSAEINSSNMSTKKNEKNKVEKTIENTLNIIETDNTNETHDVDMNPIDSDTGETIENDIETKKAEMTAAHSMDHSPINQNKEKDGITSSDQEEAGGELAEDDENKEKEGITSSEHEVAGGQLAEIDENKEQEEITTIENEVAESDENKEKEELASIENEVAESEENEETEGITSGDHEVAVGQLAERDEVISTDDKPLRNNSDITATTPVLKTEEAEEEVKAIHSKADAENSDLAPKTEAVDKSCHSNSDIDSVSYNEAEEKLTKSDFDAKISSSAVQTDAVQKKQKITSDIITASTDERTEAKEKPNLPHLDAEIFSPIVLTESKEKPTQPSPVFSTSSPIAFVAAKEKSVQSTIETIENTEGEKKLTQSDALALILTPGDHTEEEKSVDAIVSTLTSIAQTKEEDESDVCASNSQSRSDSAAYPTVGQNEADKKPAQSDADNVTATISVAQSEAENITSQSNDDEASFAESVSQNEAGKKTFQPASMSEPVLTYLGEEPNESNAHATKSSAIVEAESNADTTTSTSLGNTEAIEKTNESNTDDSISKSLLETETEEKPTQSNTDATLSSSVAEKEVDVKLTQSNTLTTTSTSVVQSDKDLIIYKAQNAEDSDLNSLEDNSFNEMQGQIKKNEENTSTVWVESKEPEASLNVVDSNEEEKQLEQPLNLIIEHKMIEINDQKTDSNIDLKEQPLNLSIGAESHETRDKDAESNNELEQCVIAKDQHTLEDNTKQFSIIDNCEYKETNQNQPSKDSTEGKATNESVDTASKTVQINESVETTKENQSVTQDITDAKTTTENVEPQNSKESDRIKNEHSCEKNSNSKDALKESIQQHPLTVETSEDKTHQKVAIVEAKEEETIQAKTSNKDLESEVVLEINNDEGSAKPAVSKTLLPAGIKHKLQECPLKLKEAVVRIKRLKVIDCKLLRQPRVFVNRIKDENTENNGRMSAVVDDSTKSSTDSTNKLSATYTGRPQRKVQKNKRHYSQSSSDDEISLNVKQPKFARKQTAKRSQIPTGRPMGRPKKLVATPRSASGLKMRISSATTRANAQPAQLVDNIELIQISSSSSANLMSSDEDEIKPITFIGPVSANRNLPIMRRTRKPEADPLYEEEIILCD